MRKQIHEKKYTGRKKESLARQYTRLVLGKLLDPENIAALKSGKSVSDYIELREYNLDLDNLIGIEYDFAMKANNSAMYATGSFVSVPNEPEISYISVDIGLPQNFKKQYIQQLYEEIVEIMRHEIEHAYQGEARLEKHYFEGEEFGSKEEMIKYFSSPIEVEAWVSGWMKKAKVEKKDWLDIANKELNFIFQTAVQSGLSEEEVSEAMEVISRRFFNHYKKRYGKS